MATLNEVLCGACEAQHITKYADIWCSECEEGLCSDCQKHHGLLKGTRNHVIIPIDQYKKLPPAISDIVHHCKEHGIKFTNYCTHHDTLCCPVCISTTHVSCTGFLSVQEISKKSKTSTLLDNMEQSLNDCESNIERSIQNRKQNLDGMKEQKQNFHEEIKNLRARLNSRFDILEHKLLQELNAEEEKITSDIEDVINYLTKKQNIVKELKTDIEALKEHGSDLQTFFGCQMYNKEVEKVEKYTRSLSEDGRLNQLNLKCNINDLIWEKLGQIESFGSVSRETSPPTLVIKSEKDKQAQITAESINDIKLSLIKTCNIPYSSNYRGCIIHPGGKLIFTDNAGSKIVVLNSDGVFEKEIICTERYAQDITTVNDSTLAISIKNSIHIINIENNQVEKVIKRNQWCFGITYHQGTLLWCEVCTGIQRMDLSDWSISTLVKQNQLPSQSYVTTYGDKIYQACNSTNAVTCYTSNGQKQWEYKNTTILKSPLGIAVDSKSYVYVTANVSQSVVVLTPDGKEGRKLLVTPEPQCEPYGIYFDKAKNNLLISYREGPAFLYHVS